jgi:glycine/D-amino acid oxidase-like deaminating enzyme
VAVVGGGIAGLTTAYLLAKAGVCFGGRGGGGGGGGLRGGVMWQWWGVALLDSLQHTSWPKQVSTSQLHGVVVQCGALGIHASWTSHVLCAAK